LLFENLGAKKKNSITESNNWSDETYTFNFKDGSA
jgi:hypothetical protein